MIKKYQKQILSIFLLHHCLTLLPAEHIMLQLRLQPLEKSREISANVFSLTDGAEIEKHYKEDGSVHHICNNKNAAMVKNSLG